MAIGPRGRDVRKPPAPGRRPRHLQTVDLDDDQSYRVFSARDARFDGRLYVGVHTTGIYCRPVCPARTPRRENVSFYPSAAAAQEAGFRPCLRCRPELAPNVALWRGTANTISRALSLIEAGALDRADVAALAERLGLGERQLRRLFQQHLGASPVAVANTRRVLLAKQLLAETQLPLAKVAAGSGFGSIRRFNESFQQLFGKPPSSLRAAGVVRRTQTSAVTINLPYRAPYAFGALLSFLRARAIRGIECVTDDRYTRSIALAGAPGTVSVVRGPGDSLKATIRVSQLAALPTVIARLRRVFDLAADIQAIEAHLSEDPLLARLVAARPGLRVPGAWDGLELSVRAILGQQISVSAATGLAARLVRDYGEPLPIELQQEGVTHLFPSAERLARDLSLLPMPRARSGALSALAAALLDEPQLLEPRESLGESIRCLCALRGVGEWTAHYIAMRQLREPDALPSGDVGLLRALGRLDGGERATPAALLARAERWRPWRSYATLHLWMSEPGPHEETP